MKRLVAGLVLAGSAVVGTAACYPVPSTGFGTNPPAQPSNWGTNPSTQPTGPWGTNPTPPPSCTNPRLCWGQH